MKKQNAPQTRSEILLTEIRDALTSTPIEVESLSVTENDTYTAPSGKAYSPVIVNVPTGGGDGVPGVTVLRGSGTTPLELPSGFDFPPVSSCFSSDTSAPVCGAWLLYVEGMVHDDMMDEDTSITRYFTSPYFDHGNDYISFDTAGEINASFSVENGEIAIRTVSLGMASINIDSNVKWCIVVIDDRT